MLEFFHISDLHLGDRLQKNQTKKVRAFVKRLFDQFNFVNSPNKFLIITGDITNSGEELEYKDAKEILLPFKNRLFIIPGNHDYGTLRSTLYSEERAKRFDLVLRYEFYPNESDFFVKKVFIKEIVTDNEKVLLIGLNSCNKKRIKQKVLHFAMMGRIGFNQLNELKQILNNQKYIGFKKILYLHHRIDEAEEFYMDLFDRDDLIEIAGPYVDVICFGHQGVMIDPNPSTKTMLIKQTEREMKVRYMNICGENVSRAKINLAANNEKFTILDADRSVKESSCFAISIDKDAMKFDLIKIVENSKPSLKAVPTTIKTAKRSSSTSSKKRDLKKGKIITKR